MTAVLDASALLAFLQAEPGAAEVAVALSAGAHISAANWAEVLAKLSDRGRDPDVVTATLEAQGVLGQGLIVEPMIEADALESARLRSATRPAGLPLGDRTCLALGLRLGLTVLTTDRTWTTLGLKVAVRTIR